MQYEYDGPQVSAFVEADPDDNLDPRRASYLQTYGYRLELL